MRLILLSSILMCFALNISAQTSPAKDSTVWGNVETNFPGGGVKAYNQYLSKEAQYPADALKNHVSGCALVEFIIEKDSTLSQVKVFMGCGSGIDDEAKKLVLQSGKWTPTILNGNSMRTKCKAAISFLITHDSNKKTSYIIDGNSNSHWYLDHNFY